MNPVLPGEYYEPYDSDTSYVSDDTDDTDDSGYLSNSEDPRIRREEDPRYMILQSKSLNIPGKKLSKDNPTNQYAEYDTKTDITSYKDLVYLNPPKTTKTSLFCVRSDSRDVQVFPSPMNFTIKLPRVYKNITKLQLVQISFPNNSGGVTADSAFTSSFVTFLLKDGVPPCCISTCITTVCAETNGSAIGIVEQGRLNESGTPLMTTVAIPDGAYTSSAQMGNELTYQANNTPPFNVITYETFRDIFMNTRDISVLFNEPGECFSSKTNNKRYGAHTKENIMNTYYTQQHIDSFPEITEIIAFNAYYYPILKELLATQRAKPFLNTDILTFDTVMNRIMGTFEGLESTTYYKIGHLNQNILDIFRRSLTFELRNVNKYQWIYNEETKQFVTIHDTLHASIHNDIQKQYQTITNQELCDNGFNNNSFRALKTSLLQYKCIYKHLETNLSTVLGNYHFVSGYQYHGGDLHSTIESTFQCFSDLQEDCDFTSMFCYHSTIGRIYGNYTGIPMNFTSFQDYHSTLSSYYTIMQSTNQTISSIQGTIASQHHEYVSTKYNNILPQSVIQTESYMSNQALPVHFITNRRLYVPGQNIVPQSGTRHSSTINTSATVSINTPVIISTISTISPSRIWFQTLRTVQSESIADSNVIVIPSDSTNISILAATLSTPSAPTINSVTPTNEELIIAFTPPTSDGGSPITGYQISLNEYLVQTDITISPFFISGLTNGITYAVTLQAINSVGIGASSNTVSGTPNNIIPNAPTINTIISTNQQLTVYFTEPTSNGGTPIIDYQYSTGGPFLPAGSIASPLLITGLTNGTTYPVTLRAVNLAGAGASSNTVSGTPVNIVPSSPTINTVISRNGELSVVFTAPTSNGGSPIINYQYSTGGPFLLLNSIVSPFLITGLTNGITYPVTIRAINSAGTGASSNTVSGTPVSDNCGGQCSCADRNCCKYCVDLNAAPCFCKDTCCAQVESIIASWYSCIPVNTMINTLAYRLGVLNPYSGFNITSTVNSILPPFNNNLFMSINDEMGFNNMDVAMPENYAVSNETTGQLKLMFAKIMFTGIGKSGDSQVLFQNPLVFETPLGKLDRLTFKIYYDDAAITPVWLASPFPQLVSEWNAIINIEEEVSQASRTTGWGANPTIPIPINPNATPYLSYTSKDNPNNRK